MTKPADEGHREAHTRADLAADAAPPSAEDAWALADVAGSPDLLSIGGLAGAAELVASERRARGRPRGATNKRNQSLIEYLQALGHRDPAVTLSMFQTADTKDLAKALGIDTAKGRAAVAALQVRAAGELLPYFYAKKPVQLDLGDVGSKRPLMVIGEMNVQIAAANGFMSAGVPPSEKANEINGDAVRESGTISHEGEQEPDS